MNRQSLLRQLPIALVVITAGVGIAQSAVTGRVFPYVGYLEEDGFPVDGDRDMRVNLYASDAAGTACDVQYFDDVPVNAGRFSVQVEDVPDNCLNLGELFASVAVGPVDGTLIDLGTGTGSGRVLIGAVPFAAASPRAATLLIENDADVGGDLIVRNFADLRGDLQVDGVAEVFTNDDAELAGGGSLVLGSTSSQNLALDADEVMARNNGSPGTLYLNNNGGTTNVGGLLRARAGVQLNKQGNTSRIGFDAQANDPGEIIHYETNNAGELWFSSSDDWDAAATNDYIFFGEYGSRTWRHYFRADGAAHHRGKLTVDGRVQVGVDGTVRPSAGDASPEVYELTGTSCTRGEIWVGRPSAQSNQDALCACLLVDGDTTPWCFNP
jgi:hypothetical protein